MSTHAPKPAKRSRWMDWKPKARIMGNSAESKPTKPSKPGFVGFVGATSEKSARIEPHGGQVILEGQPKRNGQRGNPRATAADLDTHRGMQKPIETAVDFGPESRRLMSWPKWKAAALNQLFLEQGRTGKPGRITAETVRHGERAPRRTGQNVVDPGETKAEA